MGSRPAPSSAHSSRPEDREAIDPLVHRGFRGRDLVALLLVLQRMLRESGSIERFFVAGDDPSAPDIGPALDAFFHARAAERSQGGIRAHAGAARRLLFLSAPIRRQRVQTAQPVSSLDGPPDAIDLGVWTAVSPARLIIPLDTHVIRLDDACA
jgi:hypothetical protein